MKDIQERISEVGDGVLQVLPNLNKRENRHLKKQTNWSLWDHDKRANIYVLGVLEGEKKEGRD